MNDDQLRVIYTEGNAESHAAGLRAVYEAGRKHDERERDHPDTRSTTTQGEVDARHAAGKKPQGELVDPGIAVREQEDVGDRARLGTGFRNDARLDALERGQVVIEEESEFVQPQDLTISEPSRARGPK